MQISIGFCTHLSVYVLLLVSGSVNEPLDGNLKNRKIPKEKLLTSSLSYGKREFLNKRAIY